MQLKYKRALGLDGLKSERLKIINGSMANPISYLTNKSVQGHFPFASKLAAAFPIYKQREKQI